MALHETKRRHQDKYHQPRHQDCTTCLKRCSHKIKHPGSITWLLQAPSIETLEVNDAKEPYPLTSDEQDCLFRYLSDHLKDMALFAVNIGCRYQEICHLRWGWEQPVPECNTSVFVIPGAFTKNKQKVCLPQ